MEAQDSERATPLHIAARMGNLKAAQVLLIHGADVHVRSDKGCTPLHDASWEGYSDILRPLLEYGEDVSAQNDDRDTPLDTPLHLQ